MPRNFLTDGGNNRRATTWTMLDSHNRTNNFNNSFYNFRERRPEIHNVARDLIGQRIEIADHNRFQAIVNQLCQQDDVTNLNIDNIINNAPNPESRVVFLSFRLQIMRSVSPIFSESFNNLTISN
jgi:hypothetical protein